MFRSLMLVVLLMSFSLTGCTVIFQKGIRNDKEKLTALKSELTELERAKKELEDRMAQEIKDKQVKVEMLEKGLVITFVSEVLFDSGKDVLKPESMESLNKVLSVLETTVKDLNIGVEGHTDNQPIKFSAWKSNWELSSARSLSVLHYLIEKGISPDRLCSLAYGEYHPVVDNDTKENRQKNRRVEIVILPKTMKQSIEK